MIEEQNFLKGYEISGLELNKRMYKIVAFRFGHVYRADVGAESNQHAVKKCL